MYTSGSRDGAVVRALASQQCGPVSTRGPGVICGLSLLLVLVLAPRGFSSGTPVFLSPQKPKPSKFQLDLERKNTFKRASELLSTFDGTI